MSDLALALVLAAALVHALWNYLLKASGGGTVFVWLFATVSLVVYAPLALLVAWWQGFVPAAAHLAFIGGSAALHAAYFHLLDRAYHGGDLSLVYPLARATGPLLTIAVAITALGEHPTPLGLAGGLIVVFGAFLLAMAPAAARAASTLRAIALALATGVLIAAYTVLDKQAVSALMIPPLVLDTGTNAGRVLLLAPLVRGRRNEIRDTWRSRRRAVVAVGLLCPLSYVLVLTAMSFTPVSYVAPARELSILFATVMGTRWLNEPQAGRRLFAAAIMVTGIIALALG